MSHAIARNPDGSTPQPPAHARRRRSSLVVPIVLIGGVLIGIAMGLAADHLLASGAWGGTPLAERGGQATDNHLLVIEPYRHAGTWVFDDPRVGLQREPFVRGIPEMIDRLVADLPAAEQGFRLIFSAADFPGHEMHLLRVRDESGGTWYRAEGYRMEGWLCPALFRYFDEAPAELYVRAEAL